MLRFLFAGLVAAASATPAQTSLPTYGAWNICKMGGGGYLQNVVPCPSNPRRFYTYIDVGGLARSDDGGQTWRFLHGNFHTPPLKAASGDYEVRGLIVDPRDDNNILVATGSQWNAPRGVYRSTDGGESFQLTLTARFLGNGPQRGAGFILARHPRNADLILAASAGGGVFRSSDNGQTWKASGAEGAFATDVRFDTQNPQRAYLCAQKFDDWLDGKKQALAEGFFRSDDGGQNWKKLSDESPNEILQDPSDAARLFGIWDGKEIKVSRDGGATWQGFSAGLPIKPNENLPYNSPSRFQALAAGPDFVLTASSTGIFYRLNKGETQWRKIERQGIEEIYCGETWFRHKSGGMGWALGSITVNPRDANNWFFTDWFAIYQTNDAGKHWRLSMDGIEDTVLHTLLQDPSDPGVVHLGMADNGYFLSENGGERFYLGQGISNNVKCIDLSPKQPSRLYAVGPRTWEWEANQVFVSIDRGKNWARSPMTGLPDMEKEARKCNTIVCDPRDPLTVYLAVAGDVAPQKGGIYRSTDGGKSWTWWGDGLPTAKSFFRESIWDQGREIAVSPDGSIVLISRERSELYRRGANDTSWTKIDSGARGAYFCVISDARTPGRYFLGVKGGGIFRSVDGGKSWTKIYNGSAGHIAVDGANPQRLAAGTPDGPILSTDGGQTWTELDKKLPYRVDNIVAFAGERLIVGTGGNGAFWMALSEAGKHPQRAQPATIAALPGAPTELPKIINGDMSEANNGRPAGWNAPWIGSGTLVASRDTQMFRSAPASLSLRSENGAAYGTISQSFKPVAAPFALRGWVRARGQIEECLVAVQVFDAQNKQIAWLNLASPQVNDQWHQFKGNVSMPGNAVSCNLVLTLKGQGQAWLDDLEVLPLPQVFP
jgi:photosystem II stability/assembly factor-like uncharacterized protein